MWFVRRVLPILAGECALLWVFFLKAYGSVSWSDVGGNIMTRMTHYSLPSFGRYVMASFSQAELLTSALVLAVAIMSFFAARNIVRVSRELRRNFLRPSRVI